MNPTGHDPAILLRVDRRLRALARELLRDSAEAEDVAQETWLAAFESGPIRSLPAWLSTVVRRLALDRRRASGRRERREATAARAEAVPAAVEILEREEARRRVVQALLALDEPLRTTLILRFLEELPPRTVAARMEVPVETVRSRTRRGLERLRERLDGSFGDRKSWCSALLPLLRSPSAPGALPTSLVVMSIPKKVALVVVLGGIGWLAWSRGPGGAEPSVARDADGPAALQESKQLGVAELAPAEDPAPRATLPSEAENQHPAPESFGSLRVRATWSDGTPAPAITVYARPDSANRELEQLEGSTDPSGILLLARVPVGSMNVVLDRDIGVTVEVEPGKEKEVTLAIPRGFDLGGVVQDPEGHPIPNAEVWFGRPLLVGGVAGARTGADGRFFLRSLPCGQTLAIAACARGFRPSKPELTDGEEGEVRNLGIVLRRGAGQVAGTVIDSTTGAPLPDALVGVGSRTSMEARGGGKLISLADWSRRTRTDDAGRFEVTGIDPGPCCIAARKPGHSLQRREMEVREDQTETVDLALLPEAALAGHVLDEQGRPVSGLTVTAGTGVAWLCASARTGADGSFHIGALEADATLEAQVLSSEGCVASTTFRALPGQTHEWEARLGAMGVLRVRLLDEGNHPLAGWPVQLLDSEHAPVDSATTDPEGRHRFELLPPKEHILRVFDPGVMQAYSECFTALCAFGVRPGPDEVVLRVPSNHVASAHIVGAFLDEQGLPIPGAEVIPWYESGGTSTGLDCEETTGRFELGPFPPGRWRLHLQAPGRATVFLGPRDLARDETWDCGEVRAAPSGRLVARLETGGIEPGRDLKLRIRQGGWWRPEELGDEGLVRSVALPPGSFEIDVLGGSYDQVAIPFEIRSGEETRVDVPIRAGLPASVRVLLADPSVSTIELSITGPGATAWSQMVGRSVDGDFLWKLHLAPGTYEVEARVPGKQARGRLVVEPGGREGDLLDLVL